MTDGEGNEGSDTPPGVQIGGEGTTYIDNCHFGDQDMAIEDNVDATILYSTTSGSVELAGNSAYVNGFEISGSGDNSAMELSDTVANIFNLRINPGYRYGLTARESAFTIDDSVIRGDNYDLRFHLGVLADMENVRAETIMDLARGNADVIQDGLLEETLSTKEEHLHAEEIAIRIQQIISVISIVFLADDISNIFG